MALSGKVAAVYQQTAAAGVAFTDQATTDIGGTHTRYQITDTAKRYWDPTQTVTVKKNGVIQSSGFTIEHLSGFVVFSSALLATDVVTVSGTALTVSQIAGMFNWKLDAEQDLADVTTFASGGWKEFTPLLAGFSGSAEAYWVNGDQFNLLSTKDDVILVLYVDSGASLRRYEMFGHIKKNSISVPVNEVIKESIEFQGDGKLFYREG